MLTNSQREFVLKTECCITICITILKRPATVFSSSEYQNGSGNRICYGKQYQKVSSLQAGDTTKNLSRSNSAEVFSLLFPDDFVETFHDSVRDVRVAVCMCQVGEVGEDGVAVTEGGSGPVVVHDEEACGVEQLIGETGC